MHAIQSVPTRGRTLNYAASVYDLLEPACLLSKQGEFDNNVIATLDPQPADRLLDIGCGTGLLCEKIGRLLVAEQGGIITGIDAAGKMIAAARKKRESSTCRFEAMAAESLQFADKSFDGVVSTLFFHHVPLDLKQKAFQEIFRVLRPGGRLVVADMDTPTTLLGALFSHVSRWLLMQPQIGENIRGVLPELMMDAGFAIPMVRGHFLGYITTFTTSKPS